MSVKRHLRPPSMQAALLALILTPIWSGASAQPAWQGEWKKTIAAAKAEGRVIVGAPRPPGMRDAVKQLWAKDYPGIDIQFVPAGGPEWPTRIRTERDAGKYLWDVYLAGPATATYRLAPKILTPLRPWLVLPEVNDPKVWGGWENAFVDAQGDRLLSIWRGIGTPWYNAKHVPPAKVKQLGFRVLLDPAYKGRIAWQDPRGRGAGQNVAALVFRVLGEQDFKRIIVDQQSVFYEREGQVADAVVREKAVFAMTGNFLEDLQPYVKAGVKTDALRPFGNTADLAYLSIGAMLVGVFDKAPHPNASKLFVNWVLTQRIQAALSPLIKTDSRRADVAPFHKGVLTPRPGEKYLSVQRADEVANRVRIQKLIRAWRP
jgi:iron(III) transport system substrate-binding protein